MTISLWLRSLSTSLESAFSYISLWARRIAQVRPTLSLYARGKAAKGHELESWQRCGNRKIPSYMTEMLSKTISWIEAHGLACTLGSRKTQDSYIRLTLPIYACSPLGCVRISQQVSPSSPRSSQQSSWRFDFTVAYWWRRTSTHFSTSPLCVSHVGSSTPCDSHWRRLCHGIWITCLTTTS